MCLQTGRNMLTGTGCVVPCSTPVVATWECQALSLATRKGLRVSSSCKRSLGTASGKGNRGVERSLSLKATCRLHARVTSAVLVDAVSSFFHGHQPDLSWRSEEQRLNSSH